MKKQELIDIINNGEFYALWEISVRNCKIVAKEINIVSHDWWSYATNVYKCEDGFVGVSGVNWIDFENHFKTTRDIDVRCKATEYEAKLDIVYYPTEVSY